MKKLIIALTTLMSLANTAQAASCSNSTLNNYKREAKKLLDQGATLADRHYNCVENRLAYTSGSCSAIKSHQDKLYKDFDKLYSVQEKIDDLIGDIDDTSGDKCHSSSMIEKFDRVSDLLRDRSEKFSYYGLYVRWMNNCESALEQESRKKNCN